MNGKIYARQINPEYQESPLWLGDGWPDGVIVTGNHYYTEHTTPEYDAITARFDELADEWDSTSSADSWYKNRTALCNDLLNRGRPYTTKEVHRIGQIVKEYNEGRQNLTNVQICVLLSLMTGNGYMWQTIRGCCPGDWQECFYPIQWNPYFIDCFEAEYFNTGTEWVIHDEDEAPESPEDINGVALYCYTYNPAEEIAREMGANVADVVLYQFDGYTKSPRYTLVTA